MGVLHHIGLVNDHKGIFRDVSILDAIVELQRHGKDFSKVILALMRYLEQDYSEDRLEYFIPSAESPKIIKNVGTSQYTDGVRIEKEYHEILNPSATQYYVARGFARKIKVLFNNKVFDAEYRYENQTNKNIELQSIRFRKELKEEFRKVFPEPNGTFSIEYGTDLNHFVFNHSAADFQYFEDDEKEYVEGRIAFKKHRVRERNPALIKKAKEKFIRENDGRLFCEACGFDFHVFYGDRGKDFIEGHHKKLVSELEVGETTKIEDICMLCSNCHRMIHRKPVLSIEELAEKIQQNTIVENQNVNGGIK